MNNILNVHQNIAKSKINLPIFIEAIGENQIYQNKQENVITPVVNLITKFLKLPENINEGLQILDCYLDQYSEDMLQNKGISWIQCLTEKLGNPGSNCDVSLVFKVLSKLLVISSQFRDLNKSIEEKQVQIIIENIVNSSTKNLESLRCLEVCLKLFGGKSGQFKRQIEVFCFSIIDLNNDDLVEQAAKCLHYLQQSRGGGNSGGIHKKCWTEYHSQIIGSLEQLHSQLFKNVVDVEVSTGISERLKLEELKLSPEPVTKFASLLIRFKNVCKLLEVALLEPFPLPKVIQFNRILNFIDAGLSIDQVSVERKAILDNVVLGTLLSQIQQKLLRLLKSVMLLLGGNIITKSKTICDVLVKVLKSTGGKSGASGRALISLRIECYEAFDLLMKISKNNVHIKNISENLIHENLLDIVPPSDKIILTTSANTKQSKKRKFTQKNFNEKPHNFRSSENILNEKKLCKKALETMLILLDSTGSFLKPVFHKIMQDKILLLAFNIVSKFEKRSDFYEDAECRLNLFKVLAGLISNSSSTCPPPLSYGLEILTKAKQSDPNLSVRENCCQILIDMEKIIHPKKEIFYFPTDVKDFRDTIKFNQQILNKFENLNGTNENGKKTSDTESSEDEEEEVENVAKLTSTVISDSEEENSEAHENVIITSDEDGEKLLTIDLSSENEEAPMKKKKLNESSKENNNSENLEINEEKDEIEVITPDIEEETEEEEDVEMEENLKPQKKLSNTETEKPEIFTPEKEALKVSKELKSTQLENEDDLVNEFAADFVDELNADL